MTPYKPKTRLFVDTGLAAGASMEISEAQSHYLSHVMRLDAGDGVVLFNGRDGEWSALIGSLAKKRGKLTAEELLRPQSPEPGPWLAFAPIKKAATDFIIEKATEQGVSRLCPVFTKNTNTTRINPDRFRAHAIEAAEQSQRLTVPEIMEAQTLDQLITGWPAGRVLLHLDESGGGRPIAEVLAGMRGQGGGDETSCGFLSGPEGGFDAGELDALGKLDFVTGVDLGPRVLRADTAALSALACWQALLGGSR
jgi:16S rRNA (uracil1498-N3)-methyltransferase